MGEIENQTPYLLLAGVLLLLGLFFRTIYYYLSFCTPYIVKNYSHLIDNRELVDYFITKRNNLIFLAGILFYLVSTVYLIFVIYKFFNSVFLLLILIVVFLFVFFIVDFFIKDLIFMNINKVLKFFGGVIGFLKLFSFLTPLASFLNVLNGMLLKIFEQNIDLNKKYFSEVIVYLDDFDWDDYKLEIIEKFLSMDDTLIREIMIPRVDIVALEASKTVSEVINVVMKYGYSKYPVYEETIDNIIGVVFLKDMIKYVLMNQGFIRLKDIVRIPLIVPESKNIYELLNIMKQNRASIAIVVDEYGGTSGCVTITDLIHELIGKIKDEHDKDAEDEDIQKISDKEYIVNSKIDIYSLEEYLGFDFPDKDEREYTTLAGLIYTKLGRIPQEGEVLNLNNLILKILEIKKNKISKVLIKIED